MSDTWKKRRKRIDYQGAFGIQFVTTDRFLNQSLKTSVQMINTKPLTLTLNNKSRVNPTKTFRIFFPRRSTT